jgi:hypothetical protein
MEYRGIEYTVVQGIKRGVWKWSAFVAGSKKFGQKSVRSAAVAAAESAIDRALDDRRPVKRWGLRSDERVEEVNSIRWALASFAVQLDELEARLSAAEDATAAEAHPAQAEKGRRRTGGL